MRVIKERQRKKQDVGNVETQRRGLLAKVHIAIKELKIPEDDYRNILKLDYGVVSAADLSIEELADFLKRCEASGWKAKHTKQKKKWQVKALRHRASEIANELQNGERRLRGLCRSICGVEVLEWCKDVNALKRLLAAMANIKHNDLKK